MRKEITFVANSRYRGQEGVVGSKLVEVPILSPGAPCKEYAIIYSFLNRHDTDNWEIIKDVSLIDFKEACLKMQNLWDGVGLTFKDI